MRSIAAGGTGFVAIAPLVAIGLSGQAVAGGDRDCSDFANQKQAQEFFNSHNPSEDPHNLDADGDLRGEPMPVLYGRPRRRGRRRR